LKVRVRVGGREVEADVEELGSNRYRVVIDGYTVEVEIPGPAVVPPTPTTITIARSATVTRPAAVPTRPSAPTPPAARGNVITAPISGKVIRVLVKPGDRVEPRTVVMTLESMKMELEVYAGRSGVVKEILVKPGDSVKTGQPLVTLE